MQVSDNLLLTPNRQANITNTNVSEGRENQLSPSAIKAQYDALDSQYAHLFSEFDDLSPQIDSVFFVEHSPNEDRPDRQTNRSTRFTQSHQISSMNQTLQIEQNNLLPNSMLDKNHEAFEHQASQSDSTNDNHKSNKHQPFLKSNGYSFSSGSNSMWTNTVNIESSRKTQKNDNLNNVKKNSNEIGANDQVSIGTNTFGTSGQITRIKRSSDNMYSTGLSPGNLKYGYTGQMTKRARAI
jgi:hypothetical protein